MKDKIKKIKLAEDEIIEDTTYMIITKEKYYEMEKALKSCLHFYALMNKHLLETNMQIERIREELGLPYFAE